MLRILRFIFIGKWDYCNHKWNQLHALNGVYATYFLFECSECGKHRKKRL